MATAQPPIAQYDRQMLKPSLWLQLSTDVLGGIASLQELHVHTDFSAGVPWVVMEGVLVVVVVKGEVVGAPHGLLSTTGV